MIVNKSRQQLRQQHKEGIVADKENTRILTLLSDDKYQKGVLLGILASTGTLPDFYESVLCKCCGLSNKKFSSEAHRVCTDCLGRSIGGTMVPEWASSPISFLLKFPDGTERTFSSISGASKILGYPQSSLQQLVIGHWDSYKDITCEVIPSTRTFDDMQKARAIKSLSPVAFF